MPPPADKVRFPNLNALRFFAAIAVVLFHMEHKKSLYGLPTFWHKWYFLSTIGYHAVTFFFVLSGFLITYLLLKERDTFGSISIRRFYGRRVLRILPVYLMTLLVGFFVLPHLALFHVPGQSEAMEKHFWPAFGLSLAFLSNLVLAMYSNLASVDQTWSVSTEEQFYLFWPIVMTFLPRKWLVATMVLIAVVLGAFRYHYATSPTSVVALLFMLNRFGCMAIGGLCAVLVMDKPRRLLAFFTSPITFFVTLVLTAVVLSINIFPSCLMPVQAECYSILFGILIVNFAAGAGVKAPLDSPLLRLAGDCSYAAYMYHDLFIALGCNLLLRLGYKHTTASIGHINLMLYPFVLFLTFFASWLSYKLMERPILRFKSRFSPIQSSS